MSEHSHTASNESYVDPFAEEYQEPIPITDLIRKYGMIDMSLDEIPDAFADWMIHDFRLEGRWGKYTESRIYSYLRDLRARDKLAEIMFFEKMRTGRRWSVIELPLRYIWTIEDELVEDDSD